MTHYTTIETEIKHHCLTISLNRPEQRNALNEQMIYDLTTVFSQASEDPDLRTIIIQGNGVSFCAGADINWMKKMAQYTPDNNKADASMLAHLLHVIFMCPIPVIASVHGHAFGGAIGILAACDSVVAEADTSFSLSEVKIGLIPATIYPYLLHKMGYGATTHLSLTATRFNAKDAKFNSLIHCIVSTEERKKVTRDLATQIEKNSPAACRAAKSLLRELKPIEEIMRELTSDRLAAIRVTNEAQEGLSAFLEKRKPNWIDEQ